MLGLAELDVKKKKKESDKRQMWNSCHIEHILMCWLGEFLLDIAETIMRFHGNGSLAYSTQLHRKVVQHLAMVGQMSLGVLCLKDPEDI